VEGLLGPLSNFCIIRPLTVTIRQRSVSSRELDLEENVEIQLLGSAASEFLKTLFLSRIRSLDTATLRDNISFA